MVQGGLKKVQGGLEPPLAPHFPRLCVNLFVSIQFFKELNSELPIISRLTMFLAVRNKQVSSANSLGIVCNAFLISLT